MNDACFIRMFMVNECTVRNVYLIMLWRCTNPNPGRTLDFGTMCGDVDTDLIPTLTFLPLCRCSAVCHRVTWGRSWSWKVFCPSPVWIKKILLKLRRNLRRLEVSWSSFLSISWVSRTFCHPLVLKRPWCPWRCGPETQRMFLLQELYLKKLCDVTVMCVLTHCGNVLSGLTLCNWNLNNSRQMELKVLTSSVSSHIP